MAVLTPQAFMAPKVPPKFTEPLVAETKSGMALAPVSVSVGKVKYHHLKPETARPLRSAPLRVPLEMKSRALV